MLSGPGPGPGHLSHANAGDPVGRIQAEHLISRGHRRIGYAMPAHPGLLDMAADRLRGAVEACAGAGLEPPVVLSTSLETPVAAAVGQWRSQSVTGVCAFNDETAIAVLAGLRERGLAAPADLAVIGVDEAVIAGLAGREPHVAAREHWKLIERAST
jgi:DNA-binding LacI/PurR family transcriptional regulator